MTIKTQIVIWANRIIQIGGIETFIYNFCMNMRNNYDIIVMCEYIDILQLNRLIPYVKVIINNPEQIVECDTVITNNILIDKVPPNVKYKKKIQMVHGCKLYDTWHIPYDNDLLVPVSSAVINSFKDELPDNKTVQIGNFTYPTEPKKVLRLVSATRLTEEKGGNRMLKLADMLVEKNIPYIWTVFTNRPLNNMPNGMVCINPTMDIKNYIADSDYLVQLSSSEAFCYSIVESLELGTPVITTPLPVLDELGFQDGINGYKVPFNMEGIDVEKIYNYIPTFTYKRDNEEIKKNWKAVLGESIPIGEYTYNAETDGYKIIEATNRYYDTKLARFVIKGEQIMVTTERAKQINKAGLCQIIQ